MKNRKKIVLCLIVGAFILLAALLLIGVRAMSYEGYGVSTGKLYTINGTSYLIDDSDRAMIVSDYSKNKNIFKNYKNGDKLIVIHGLIEETYPSRTDGYYAFRVSKSDGTYKLYDDKILGIVNTGDDDENNSPVDHTHEIAEKEQTVNDPVEGYCGNTQTTIHFDDGKSYTFMYSESVTMTDILINLDYNKKKVCKCLPEYTVDTEFNVGYGVNLSEGYVRCEKGQAELTKEQVEKLSEIISWANEKAGV